MSDRETYDLIVIGAGFGGSLLSLIARRLGLSVVLLEKGSHPRFAIGESTSPLANLLLEQIARQYDLPRLLPLTSYGSWQQTYPALGCGLKRGFSFFHHQAGQEYHSRPDRSNELLVAASPQDEVADTHWLRADVDTFLVQEAVASGAEYHDHVMLTAYERTAGGITTLGGQRQERAFSARTRLVVDATGPHGFLSHALQLPHSAFAEYPPTQGLYSHFRGVQRCDGLAAFQNADEPPYPKDDAAVHHIFDGGWMWVLRFGNGLTSAGVALTDPLAQEIGLADGEPAWQRLLSRYPTVSEQFSSAEAAQPFTYAPRLAYRAHAAAGPGWALLPSAASFIDPLFSTGIPLTLLGIERLGQILQECWGREELNDRLEDYSNVTLKEADGTADFISACYAAMPCFPVFAALSMFYFAAASYGEIARRLGQERATRFLAADHPQFDPALRRCTDQVRQSVPTGAAAIKAFEAQVADAVACLNIAGLCRPQKRNWYGVDLGDVVEAAAKLGMTPEGMRGLLKRAPWAQPNSW